MEYVLLPIEHKLVERIFSGEKKCEFRKPNIKKFKDKKITKIYIYQKSKTKGLSGQIVGSFEIESIHNDTPEKIWKKCKHCGGVSEKEFYKYYDKYKGLPGKNAYAIKIRNIQRCKGPIDPKSIDINFNIPQSFCYISRDHKEDSVRKLFRYISRCKTC
mgnify:CR=1 FL=1